MQIDIDESAIQALIAAATAARTRAYVPYSHFAVGAALQTSDGAVYAGCNIENASYGLTVCAERTAVFNAVTQGARHFAAIAVVTANGVSPCGACRQVLAEFGPRMVVILANLDGHRQIYTLDQLLPAAFLPTQLPGQPHEP